MNKRKRTRLVVAVILFGSFAAAAVLWLELGASAANANEVHRRKLRQYEAVYFKLNHIEHALGGDVAQLLGVQALERQCGRKSDDERAALLASGYFVSVSGTVTNLEHRTEEINERFRHVHGDAEGLTIFDTAGNEVTVICRPQYAPAYGAALQEP